MAYRKRRTTRSKGGYKKRRKAPARRRSTSRSSRVTVVLQVQPQTGMAPAGLTLGKKNYRPVRARY